MKDFNITETEADKIFNKIKALEVKINKPKQLISSENLFFNNEEFIDLMGISKRLCQQWRNDKIINYSQINGKIYYTLTDILKLIDDNKINKNKI